MIWLVSCLMVAVASLSYIFCLPKRLLVGSPKTRAEYLRECKDAVYENLRDLNFEYKAGKVPEADFESLQSSLQDEAAAILAEIASMEKSSAAGAAQAASDTSKRKRKSRAPRRLAFRDIPKAS